MIKLLYIPTGNTFVVPDNDALRIINNARDCYKILEGGLQEESEEKLLKETIQKLVVKTPEPEEEPQEQPLDWSTLSKNELVAAAKKFNITVTNRDTKATLLDKIYEKLDK